MNYIKLKAGVFVKASKKWLTVAKALADCTTELIMTIKSFMIQAPAVWFEGPQKNFLKEVNKNFWEFIRNYIS